MSNQFVTAQVIRACVMGVEVAEQNDTSPEKFLAILRSVVDELERPMIGRPSELEMHRADYKAVKAAGFEDPGELLSAYKTLAAENNAHRRRVDELLEALSKQDRACKPWTDAELRRLYDNSTAFVGADASNLSRAEFMRLVKYIEQCHGIRPE